MNDVFRKRVKSAAVAGWWTVAIACALWSGSWIAWGAIIRARPKLGPGLADGGYLEFPMMIRKPWPPMLGAFMMGLVLLVVLLLVVVWLTLWARMLKRCQ